MTAPLNPHASRTSAAQPAPSQDSIGALMVRQRREVIGVGKSRDEYAQVGEKITDLGEIARILQGCMTAEENTDDLVVELLMLESLLNAVPVESDELLEALGALGDEVREGMVPPNMIDIAALRQRTQRIRNHIGHVASRISAALVLFLTGLPFFTQPASAEEERGFAVAAAPVVRVIDSATGQGMAGVQIKTMEERLLGVTDGQGQATLGDGYMETDLLSLEKDGYEMYLLDRTQLSSRNIVSMKPNAGGASMAQAPGAAGASAGQGSAPKAPSRPAATVKPPTAPKAVTAPKVAFVDGHAPTMAAPKMPAKPAAPTIKLPSRPRPKAADLHARVSAPAALAAHPGQPGLGHKAAAPVATPEIHLPVRPAAPAGMANHGGASSHAATPLAASSEPELQLPKAPARVAAAPSAAHDAAISLPSRPRVPAMQHASNPEAAAPREQPHVAIPRRMPRHRAAAAGGSYYRVQPGDSLSKIAKRTLGSTRRWPELFAANRDKVSNPRFIRVGQTLVLPSHDAPMAAAGATYIVRRGDCLFSIASAQLGAGTKWKSIWQMNKDRVRDARFIYPGQRLTLPRA